MKWKDIPVGSYYSTSDGTVIYKVDNRHYQLIAYGGSIYCKRGKVFEFDFEDSDTRRVIDFHSVEIPECSL